MEKLFEGRCGGDGNDPIVEQVCMEFDVRNEPCARCQYWRAPIYGEFLRRQPSDPVLLDNHGRYWFCDETWTECFGPYDSEQEADAACKEYAALL